MCFCSQFVFAFWFCFYLHIHTHTGWVLDCLCLCFLSLGCVVFLVRFNGIKLKCAFVSSLYQSMQALIKLSELHTIHTLKSTHKCVEYDDVWLLSVWLCVWICIGCWPMFVILVIIVLVWIGSCPTHSHTQCDCLCLRVSVLLGEPTSRWSLLTDLETLFTINWYTLKIVFNSKLLPQNSSKKTVFLKKSSNFKKFCPI